ncbi:unnamed protein product, partial [Ectocarpus fasciculatus]
QGAGDVPKDRYCCHGAGSPLPVNNKRGRRCEAGAGGGGGDQQQRGFVFPAESRGVFNRGWGGLRRRLLPSGRGDQGLHGSVGGGNC